MNRHLSLWRAAVVVIVAFFIAGPRSASAQDQTAWHVVELNGAVTVTGAGVAPVSLTDKVDLRGGDQIQTEATGRVILRRGRDTLLIAPNSLVSLPAEETGMFTRILQTFGTVLVNVEKRPDPHFEVRTPFLAAIVKGTTFTVSADSISSAVQVVEGVVAVVDPAQGQSVNVTAGQTARINSRSGEGLRVDGPRQNSPAGVGESTARHASVDNEGNSRRISQPIGFAAIDAVKASGGLLRNDDGKPAGASSAAHAGVQSSASANRASAIGAAGGFGGTAAMVAGLARSNAGGNGNGNAFGLAHGNNAGGTGNGNAGGNGNGNAGGNGNGNAGGNGNGHGHP